jgi:hypothetical protein
MVASVAPQPKSACYQAPRKGGPNAPLNGPRLRHERRGHGGSLVLGPNPPTMVEDRQPGMVRSASRAASARDKRSTTIVDDPRGDSIFSCSSGILMRWPTAHTATTTSTLRDHRLAQVPAASGGSHPAGSNLALSTVNLTGSAICSVTWSSRAMSRCCAGCVASPHPPYQRPLGQLTATAADFCDAVSLII